MSRFPLEPLGDEFKSMGADALELLGSFIDNLPDAPASDFDGAFELGRELAAQSPPERPRPLGELLQVVATAAAKGIDTAGAGYLAFIPGGGLVSAALADLLACGLNRYVALAMPSPPCAGIETSVVRWLCQLFHLPATAAGILTSGGSMANFSAIVTARSTLTPDGFLNGTLYVTEHTHQSLTKAARLAGFGPSSMREVACTPNLTMDPEALRQAVAVDRAEGRQPFCLMASAGTTNTGAIDPLTELAEVAHDEGMWFHVDAAYGGFFQLTERGRRALVGIDQADSITLDPHKGMFLPFGTGCLLVRNGGQLRRAHQVEAEYLRDLEGEHPAIPDFADYSPELSRDFRGLRVWLPLHLHGVGAFRVALDEKLDLARHVHEALSREPNFEVPWEPRLSIVAFRLRQDRPGSNGSDDFANHRLLEKVNASRRVFLSSTRVGGKLTLRVCVLSHRTHLDRVDEAIELIRQAAAEVLGHEAT